MCSKTNQIEIAACSTLSIRLTHSFAMKYLSTSDRKSFFKDRREKGKMVDLSIMHGFAGNFHHNMLFPHLRYE